MGVTEDGCASALDFLIPSYTWCIPFSPALKETVTTPDGSKAILFSALLCQVKGPQGENGESFRSRLVTRHLLSQPGFTMLQFESRIRTENDQDT